MIPLNKMRILFIIELMDARQAQRIYKEIAGQAVALGVITSAERRLIARRGTRKAGYTVRHLRDLAMVICDRIDVSAAGEPQRRLQFVANKFR